MCKQTTKKKRANNTAKVQALSLDQKAHSIHISAHWPSEIPQESKVLSVCGALEKCFTNFQQEQSNIASKEISNKHPTVFFISIRASQPSLRKLSIMFSNVLHSFSLGGFLFLLGFLLCAPRREPSEFEKKKISYFFPLLLLSLLRGCCVVAFIIAFSSPLFFSEFFFFLLFCFKIMFHILNLSCSLLAGLRCLLRFLSPYDGVFYSPWQQERWVCAVEEIEYTTHDTLHTTHRRAAGEMAKGMKERTGLVEWEVLQSLLLLVLFSLNNPITFFLLFFSAFFSHFGPFFMDFTISLARARSQSLDQINNDSVYFACTPLLSLVCCCLSLSLANPHQHHWLLFSSCVENFFRGWMERKWCILSDCCCVVDLFIVQSSLHGWFLISPEKESNKKRHSNNRQEEGKRKERKLRVTQIPAQAANLILFRPSRMMMMTMINKEKS